MPAQRACGHGDFKALEPNGLEHAYAWGHSGTNTATSAIPAPQPGTSTQPDPTAISTRWVCGTAGIPPTA
jgi:hypothetical protein